MWNRVLPRIGRAIPEQAVDSIAAAVRRRLGIDLRALAVFRILIGSVLLFDLLIRLRNFRAFYTDAGVLPREALFSEYGTVYSLHAYLPEPWMVLGLFVVAMGFAVAVIVGYHTRIAVAVSWLLLLSLHARNPMILNGGDKVLLLLLFWGMFLPLDRRWALGGPERSFDRPRTVSVATAAVLVQMVLIYSVNAIHKIGSEKWLSGTAISYVFEAEQRLGLLAPLVDVPPLLETLTFFWVALVFSAPLLLFLTGYPRAAMASMFAGLHLGMGATMFLGRFPVVVTAGLLLFYPPAVWDDIERLLGIVSSGRGEAAGDGTRPQEDITADGGRPQNSLDEADGIESSSRDGDDSADSGEDPEDSPNRPVDPLPGERWSHRVTAPHTSAVIEGLRTAAFLVIPAVFLVLVVTSGAASVDAATVPEPGEDVLEATETDQHWPMFKAPSSTTRWFAFPAVLEDGREVDAFRGGEATYDPPQSEATDYSSPRMRKYLLTMRYADNEHHRSYFAHHLCTSWNQDHEVEMDRVEVYYHYERPDPFSEEMISADEFTLIEYDCDGALVQN